MIFWYDKMLQKLILKPGHLELSQLHSAWDNSLAFTLDPICHEFIEASVTTVKNIVTQDKIIYGINTGFGRLAHTLISADQLQELQRRIVLSHAAGVGPNLADEIVRLIMLLKINNLAQGYSGIRLSVIETLLKLYQAKIYPCIPAKGSVGASGDLAPLAHLSAVLLGVGHCNIENQIITAIQALEKINLTPLELGPKEGLALLNGTQVSTAITLSALFKLENIFSAAVVAGALAIDAASASDKPFDARIQSVRRQLGQQTIAKVYRDLIQGSALRESHRHCNRVQDPYSLRCQPQVMGTCLDYLNFVAEKLLLEANAVSDNPLVFAQDAEILSGGNFHAEPVAFAADSLALCFAEIGNMSERRIALLMDPQLSGLPAFLVNEPGLNSGFMLAHVTSAALASENKLLAHPASVDTIPTSANQEDHVSMATHGAYRLLTMAENTANIIAVELLAVCQGIDLRQPVKTSLVLQQAKQLVRDKVDFYDKDRFFAPDIAAVKQLIDQGLFKQFMLDILPSSH